MSNLEEKINILCELVLVEHQLDRASDMMASKGEYFKGARTLKHGKGRKKALYNQLKALLKEENETEESDSV